MKRERKYMGVMQLGGGAMGPNIRLRSKQRKNTRWEQDTRPKAQNLLLTMAGRNLEIYKQHDFRKGRSPLTLHLNQTLQICKDFSVLPPHPPAPCLHHSDPCLVYGTLCFPAKTAPTFRHSFCQMNSFANSRNTCRQPSWPAV